MAYNKSFYKVEFLIISTCNIIFGISKLRVVSLMKYKIGVLQVTTENTNSKTLKSTTVIGSSSKLVY